MTGPEVARLAVVVPALDEAAHLPGLLDDLAELPVDHEIVVVDGGSADGTRAAATAGGARVVDAFPGRAVQLRAGAAATTAPWLFFVHADSRVPPVARAALARFLERASARDFAYFRFRLEGADPRWRRIEAGQRLRQRCAGLVYGDQGLVVSRALYRAVGGHPRWPLMEDVGLLDRLRARGCERDLGVPLPTSPRRYLSEGRWRGVLRNALLITLYRMGVAPDRLARWYPTRRAPRRTVVVFAKAPRPGTVKTRLAADVGAAEAARVYRVLGRKVVDGLRGGPYRLEVHYAPPDAGEEVARWLGGDDVHYHPQTPGDLGCRMAAALEGALRVADRACVVGTDAPGVDRTVVSEAFERLGHADVVLGPAHDGGYYLLGLSTPRPTLFADVPWSTPDVLERTLERARSLGLRTRLLAPLGDVDTLADVPEELLRG